MVALASARRSIQRDRQGLEAMYAQLAKYLTVGVLNSGVGLLVIYACMAAGLGDVLANALGYSIGFVVSYIFNSRWTFAQNRLTASALARFLLVTGVAYLGNVCALLVSRDTLKIDHHIAQLIGVATYTVIGFAGSRRFAFRPK